MYVASFDTKALGSVRHLPIQRAAAVVNGWDFPTKQLFSFVSILLVVLSTVGESLPLIIEMTYVSSMSSGQVLVPVINQGMKSDFMGFSGKTTRAGVVRKPTAVSSGYNSTCQQNGYWLPACRKVVGGCRLAVKSYSGCRLAVKSYRVGVAGCRCGACVPRAPGGVMNVPKNNSSEGTERSRIFFSGVSLPDDRTLADFFPGCSCA